MSDFLSVYHLILGTRPAKKDEDKVGGIDNKPDIREAASPMDIGLVASAIDEGDIYHFDDFGRFGVADSEAKCKIKSALAAYGELLITGSPGEMGNFIHELHGLNNTLDWHRFGWMEEDLPEFQVCHEAWNNKNGMAGKNAPTLNEPAPQSHFWLLVGKLLKNLVGDDAYEQIAINKCAPAISALESRGFRWTENEKKALRTHLSKIVTSSPLIEM
jgi:hypothetical protein